LRAVLAERFGASWLVADRPEPEIGPRDLLVEIEASGVCYSDVHQLREPEYASSFPRIPGHEAVGRVVARGKQVEDPPLGARVGVAYTQRWCGRCRYCAEGWYEHCATADRTGFTVDGGHAELAAVDAAAAECIPDRLDPVEAAPLLCAGFTAYSGLCDAQLRPGERCAVVGVGGLGHLAVQYAAALGTEVVAVTATPRKEPLLRRLGADHVLVVGDRRAGDALRRIGGADAVVHTANGVDPELLGGLRPFGRLVLLGVSKDVLPLTPIELVFGKLSVLGSCQGPRERLREMLELHRRIGARTIVEAYRLDDALAAYDRVATGAAFLRAVLVP
jgi:dehydrogenase